MKHSLSWLEWLWYLPLCFLSGYFQLQALAIVIVCIVAYTISHYIKLKTSEVYRKGYHKTVFFIHTEETPQTLRISCMIGLLTSVVCTIYFFLNNRMAGICGFIVCLIPLLAYVYLAYLGHKH